MKIDKNKNTPKEKTQKEKEFENLSLFFDNYLSNGKLITKNATLFGVQRIVYIKGKDLKLFFTENFEEIKKEMQSIMNINIGKEANNDSLQKFYQINQQRNIFHYLQRVQGDKAKYPKKLIPLKKNENSNLEFNFSETGFYLLNIKKEKSKKPIIYLILLVALVLLIVLFPIWPLNVKLGVLYFLMSLIIFLIVFLILIIIISIVGILFGYDITIMPNIDNNKLSWKSRLFNPFYTIEGIEDPLWFKVIRIFLILSIAILGIIAYFYPAIPNQSFLMVKNLMMSLYNYATKKIEDIHYNRKAVKVKGAKYLDDLNDI